MSREDQNNSNKPPSAFSHVLSSQQLNVQIIFTVPIPLCRDYSQICADSQPSKWHSNSDHFCLRPSIFQLSFASEKVQSVLISYSHMASKVTLEPDTTIPGVQPQLFSDSVEVSIAFNPAKLPGYCSHYGYGQVTKTPFCIVTLHMKMPKYHFSFGPQTCRLKKEKLMQCFQPYRKFNTPSLFFLTTKADEKHTLF